MRSQIVFGALFIKLFYARPTASRPNRSPGNSKKKRLKPNSVPDIPLLTEDELSSDVINLAKVRGAYSKR